jgi:hypothetical protein
MTVEGMRDKAKKRLDIDADDTTFDALIEEFVTDAIDRIPPDAYKEVPVQTSSVSVDSHGRAQIDISALAIPLADVRKVEVSIDGVLSPVSFRLHSTILQLEELSSSVTSVAIYGLTPFTISDLPLMFNAGVISYILSDFYGFLAGNARYYNEYMQNGRAKVDNMADLSDYYEEKAKEYIREKGQLYGG